MTRRSTGVLILAMVLGSSCSPEAPHSGIATAQDTPPVVPMESTSTKEPPMAMLDEMPESIRTLIAAEDSILAYKPMDKAGGTSAVVIVRHNPDGSDNSQNPCELLVLRESDGVFAVADKTGKAVDCLYNALAGKAVSLEENLQVGPGKISYNNQGEKGTTRYDFAFSTEKDRWHLMQAASAYTKYNEVTDSTDVLGSEISYPKDFGWIPMSSFDPEAIQDALDKNRKLIE